MKILCFFSGSLRLDLNTYIHYINEFKKNFEEINCDSLKSIEITYLFITDKSSSFIYFDYDFFKSELYNQTGVKVLFIEKNNNLNITTQNNYPTISLMYYKHIQDYINENNLSFDYVIKIRNDLLIKINNIYTYLNKNTYVAPRYWYNTNVNSLANDHFIIIPFSKFVTFDFKDESINRLAPHYYDTEILTEHIILPDKVIGLDDIIEYLLNGTLKFHIKHNKIISSNFPPYNSIAFV